MSGYHHPAYAAALAEFGQPQLLPRSGAWVLRRPIPDSAWADAMGCYPFLACREWRQLPADLLEVGDTLISLALVTDPFGDYDLALLEQCFDRVIRFKEHFVTDLRQPLSAIVSAGHRKRARQALRQVQVEICHEPLNHLAEWLTLYQHLIQRHQITGIPAFSPAAFRGHLAMPGMIMLRALYQGESVGATLWLVQGEVGYGHLAACNERGYELRAAYALDWWALEYFASTPVRWLNFGASAGLNEGGADGLSHYKRGWATGTRPVYFCGRIFRPDVYAAITQARGIGPTNYFPAYRQGEFR